MEQRIATLEFDRDRKSMGVIVNSSSGKKSLLVKVRSSLLLSCRFSFFAVKLSVLLQLISTVVGIVYHALEKKEDDHRSCLAHEYA